MASIRTTFEKELKAKLSQKTAGRLTEEGVFMKNFRHFDLDSTGTVDLPSFMKACEKIGVHTFTKQQFEDLFKFYDTKGNKRIEYKDLSGIIFGNATAQTRQMSPQRGAKYSGDDDEMEGMMEKLKKTLAGRGPGGIVGLGLEFRIADKDHNRKLDPDEFYYGLRDFGCGFSKDECKKLFDYFDKDRDGTVDFDEFIFTIRGKLNAFRLALVNQAFDKIDKDHSGVLTIDDLKGVYNARNHPDVKQGKKTEDQVLNEFMHTFHCVYDYHEIDHDRVTRDEFTEYYAFISASIDNDQYFELMMNNAWRINEGANKRWDDKGWSNQADSPAKNTKVADYAPKRANYNAGAGEREKKSAVQRPTTAKQDTISQSSRAGDVTPPRSNKGYGSYLNNNNNNTKNDEIDIDALLKTMREKLATRGTRGFIGIQRQFKIMDDDGDHAISYVEFSKAMRDYKMNFNDAELRAVYNDFDEDGDGIVSIDEFIREIRGEMNDFRKGLVKVAFQILDRDNDGIIKVNDIKGVYSAKMHPDVKAGKKTEDEVLGEFLETFEVHHGLHAKNPRDQSVTFKEFIEYYNHVSASIDDDKYFELMMINGYKLFNRDSKYKEYAPTNTGSWKDEIKVNNRTQTVAPYGTTANAHDWSTSNRPTTSQQQERVKSSAVLKDNPAGVSSWPTGNKTPSQSSASSTYQQSSAPLNDKNKEGERLLGIFRDKVVSRGCRGIFSLGRLFRIIDDDNSKSLSPYEFQKVIKDFRMDIDENGAKTLFQVFDRDSDGLIEYDEFLRAIRGPMNENRKKFVVLAFKKLDKNGDGQITVDDIRGVYSAKNHPEVKAGKKTEDEVLGEFLDTFEMHHAFHTGDHMMKNVVVTFDEFLEYYNNVSCSIDDDRYWELMMTNAWNLNNVSYSRGWRGDN